MRIDILHILRIGSDIADMGESESDDLPGIARVRHAFLIASHRGIEADFAYARAFCAEAPAPNTCAIRQNQYARCDPSRCGRRVG